MCAMRSSRCKTIRSQRGRRNPRTRAHWMPAAETFQDEGRDVHSVLHVDRDMSIWSIHVCSNDTVATNTGIHVVWTHAATAQKIGARTSGTAVGMIASSVLNNSSVYGIASDEGRVSARRASKLGTAEMAYVGRRARIT